MNSRPPYLFLGLRVGLGLFFLVVGILKVRDLGAFTEAIFNYQILFPPYDAYAAYFVAWLEVVIGLVLIVGLWGTRGALLITAGLLAVFIAALSMAAAKGLNINCGCFSASEEPTNFPLHIGMNVLLLLVTACLFWQQGRKKTGKLFSSKGKLTLPS